MIEVNEYVRTKDGKIDKVINSNFYMSIYVECEKGLYLIENIVKHRKELIDLVEIGDIVNGHVVTNILDFKNSKKIEKMLYTEYVYPVLGKKNYIYATEVKTILTKESYVANCYKVGGEDEC